MKGLNIMMGHLNLHFDIFDIWADILSIIGSL